MTHVKHFLINGYNHKVLKKQDIKISYILFDVFDFLIAQKTHKISKGKLFKKIIKHNGSKNHKLVLFKMLNSENYK